MSCKNWYNSLVKMIYLLKTLFIVLTLGIKKPIIISKSSGYIPTSSVNFERWVVLACFIGVEYRYIYHSDSDVSPAFCLSPSGNELSFPWKF